MLKEKKTATNIGIGAGILLKIGAFAFLFQGFHTISILMLLLAPVLFIWGCINYCQGKGYPGVLGLLGLLSFFGLLAMVILPDKHSSA